MIREILTIFFLILAVALAGPGLYWSALFISGLFTSYYLTIPVLAVVMGMIGLCGAVYISYFFNRLTAMKLLTLCVAMSTVSHLLMLTVPLFPPYFDFEEQDMILWAKFFVMPCGAGVITLLLWLYYKRNHPELLQRQVRRKARPRLYVPAGRAQR